jgi:hypothetical protein
MLAAAGAADTKATSAAQQTRELRFMAERRLNLMRPASASAQLPLTFLGR